MKNLMLTAAALLIFSTAFSQVTPKRDTLINGKKIDTTLTDRNKRNTVKEATKTTDHTKITRKNKKTQQDTVRPTRTKPVR